jgi:hypothetical protein
MKLSCLLLLFLTITSFSYATTLEEIAKLSQLNTSDDLIIQLIQESPLKISIGAADVIFLKEQGVSEQVISYIWTATKSEKEILPPQEGESIWLGEGVRAYYVSTDDGQKKIVITNLDENGMRMGPLPPVPSAEPVYTAPTQATAPPAQYEIPREIYVTVRNEAASQYNGQSYNSYPSASYSNGYYSSANYYPGFYNVPFYYSPYYSYFPKMQFMYSPFSFHKFPFGQHQSFPFHRGSGFQSCRSPNPPKGHNPQGKH